MRVVILIFGIIVVPALIGWYVGPLLADRIGQLEAGLALFGICIPIGYGTNKLSQLIG
jgi:hypothetical protein